MLRLVGGSGFLAITENEVDDVKPLGAGGATSNSYLIRINSKEFFMKQLRPELKDDWRYRSAFQKEYEVGRSISSEYVVKYEAIDENADGLYILMEHVNGKTIEEKLASEPEYFACGRNFEKFFVQLLRGLKVLHEAHVAYLDLKPDNVMLTQVNNDVKIIDLGGCLADAYSHTAGTTLDFAAPELKGNGYKEVDARTDIYALGQLMCYVKDVACVNISPRMQSVIDRCTCSEKKDRYADVDEVLNAVTMKRKWARKLLITAVVLICMIAGFATYSQTEHYRMTKQLIEWSLFRNDYDIQFERNRYCILSEDSLTCMVVDGKRLENLYIHEKVPYKGKEYQTVAVADKAFGGRSIRSVYIPNGVRVIGSNAFARCEGVTSLHIPESVVKIGDHCFEAMTSLKSLQLSSHIKEIPLKAFVGCTSLEKLHIPEGVEVLGLDCFAICTGLKQVSLPSTLKVINRGAFWFCTNLKSIAIPASVETIGEYVFYECDSLTDVYNYARVPQRIPPIYNKRGITLHVPHGSEELYRQADHWNVGEVVGDL